MSAALEQVEISRERLRRAMRPTPAQRPARARPPGRFAAWLRGLPLIAEMAESLASAWSRHPLRPMAEMALDASNAMARPLAQRHPLRLMLASALMGAGLAWSRPWRWIFSSALFAGLVPQFAARVVANLPIESWMAMRGTPGAGPSPTTSPPGLVPADPAG